jgi:hypothetical protein
VVVPMQLGREMPAFQRLVRCLTIVCLVVPGIAAARPQTWAFVDVAVVAMNDDSVDEGQTVLVRDGRIVAVGAVGSVSVGNARVVDGRGRFLMPGLAEMHARIPPAPEDAQEALDVLALYVANGITLARGMLGAPHHLNLREQAARGKILAPRIYTSGQSLNGESVPSPEVGRAMVVQQHDAGYDFLKIHPGLDIASFVAIVAVAREIGMPFAGHVSDRVGLAAALTAGQASIDHLDQYLPALLHHDVTGPAKSSLLFGWNLAADVDRARIEPLASATAAAGVWNVPTQSLAEQLLLSERSTE